MRQDPVEQWVLEGVRRIDCTAGRDGVWVRRDGVCAIAKGAMDAKTKGTGRLTGREREGIQVNDTERWERLVRKETSAQWDC